MNNRTRRLLVVGVTLAILACAPEVQGPRLDPELVAALGLSGDEVVHTITLGGERTEERIRPSMLEVGEGEIVEFVTVDRRVHVLRFPSDSLTPTAQRFLEASGQDASPPLIGQGSRFVVTFKNAPPGRYPFVSSGYGEEAGGIIIVRSEN